MTCFSDVCGARNATVVVFSAALSFAHEGFENGVYPLLIFEAGSLVQVGLTPAAVLLPLLDPYALCWRWDIARGVWCHSQQPAHLHQHCVVSLVCRARVSLLRPSLV